MKIGEVREGRGDVVACLQLNKCQRGAAKSKQLLNALQRFNTKVPAPFKIAGWRLKAGNWASPLPCTSVCNG